MNFTDRQWVAGLQPTSW